MTSSSELTAPRITVVVCSYNGAGTLGRCLEALERQTIRAEAQIVVVDDGSSDSTAEVARTFDVELVVHEQNRGISQARNTGIARARAPVVAFTDDDCVPSERWLAGLLAGYERQDVVAVGGAIEPFRVETVVQRYLLDNNPLTPLEMNLETHASLPQRLLLYVKRMWESHHRSEARAVYSFPGANMSFRTEALQTIGMFDERMTFGADDEYICSRAREHFPDQLLWFDPAAVVHHDYVGTFRDLFRRNFAYGLGHARAYRLDSSSRWPIVFPVPVATIAALFVLRRSRRAVIVPLLLPLLLPQGILGTLHHRRAANLVFSYLRLVEEFAHNVGMLAGLLTIRSRRADPRS